VVIVREDQKDDKRLVVYVVKNSNGSEPTLELREYLRSKLPDFMVPSAVVEIGAIPLTPNGKLDRQTLPRPGIEISAERCASELDPLEAKLAAIWERILDIRPIGRDHNFFELGGHSLKAIRMFVEIESEFGKSIPLATLFESGTVGKLAEILRQDGWKAP